MKTYAEELLQEGRREGRNAIAQGTAQSPIEDVSCWFLEIGDRVVPLDDPQAGIDIVGKGTHVVIRVHIESPEYVDIGWTLRDPLIMNSTLEER